MEVSEIAEDQSLTKYIADFVSSPMFLVVKDAFTNHVPSGERESIQASTPDPLLIAHGKVLGTRYVFNELEKIVKASRKPKPKPQVSKGGKDPDLDDE